MRHIYGVFVGSKWGMRQSIPAVVATLNAERATNGAPFQVRRMRYPVDTRSWDAPTFRACSEDVTERFEREIMRTSRRKLESVLQ